MTDQITCPTGCADSLPAVSFSKCTPDFRASAITHLLLGKASAGALTDWTDAIEWGTRLDQSDVVADKIRLLTIIGDIPAPQNQDYTGSDNRKKTIKRTYVLNFTIDEVNDVNYDFLRTIECGGLEFKAWWISNGKKDIFGGSAGVSVTANGSFQFGNGETDVQKFVGTLEWTGYFPARATNPIAGL